MIKFEHRLLLVPSRGNIRVPLQLPFSKPKLFDRLTVCQLRLNVRQSQLAGAFISRGLGIDRKQHLLDCFCREENIEVVLL